MAKVLTDALDAARSLTAGGARQKKPSGHGNGKWHSLKTLGRYRQRRDAQRRRARSSRKRNWQA